MRSADAKPYELSFTETYWDNPAYGKDPMAFAQTVYDVMAGFSQLKPSDAKLSQSAQLLSHTIGASIGALDPNSEVFQGDALTMERQVPLRDEIKAVMRGVLDSILYPEFGTQHQSLANLATMITEDTWHNATYPCDVNGDDIVTPSDVLLVVNYLNAARPTELQDSHIVPAPDDGHTSSERKLVTLDELLTEIAWRRG